LAEVSFPQLGSGGCVAVRTLVFHTVAARHAAKSYPAYVKILEWGSGWRAMSVAIGGAGTCWTWNII
jgi:hypothetical protein